MKTSQLLSVFIVILFNVTMCNSSERKKPLPYNQTKQKPKFDNPAFVRDRFRKIIVKPGNWADVNKAVESGGFNPSYMDFCDPYHCNDYHKTACGLNRANMRFKWFQSVCHLILNNKCADYRGALKYDLVETKFCVAYVMFLRSKCDECAGDQPGAVCAVSISGRSVVLFEDGCAMKKANCRVDSMDDYFEVDMKICQKLYSGEPEEFSYSVESLLRE